MPKTRLLLVLVLLVFATVGVSQSLRADTIAAGESTTSLTDFSSDASTLTYLNSTNLANATPNNIYVESAVYSGTGGNLYFMYQIQDHTDIFEVDLLTVTNFTGFTTDVGYIENPTSLSSNPFASPTLSYLGTVNRSGSGAAVTFNGSTTYLYPLATHGSSSYVLVVKTDATSYDSKGTFLLNASDPTGSFEPIPEPGTLPLLGAGLLGLALLGSLKRRAVCSSRISA